MKLVVFNNKHELDLSHEILYFDASDVTTRGVEAIADEIRAFSPELIIEEEKNDGLSRFTELYGKLIGIPRALWLIDAHCNLIEHVVYAKQFDYIFCAQSWFVPIIKREVKGKVFFLPLCHTQTMTEYQQMLQTTVDRDVPFSFVGHIRSIHVDRRHYVARFLEVLPDFLALASDYQATLTYLRRSQKTFNCSLNNDLNFRVWEALACGAEVITDRVTDVEQIKDLAKHLTLYDKMRPDWQHMDSKTESDGQNFIKSGHTLTHRYLQLIDMVSQEHQLIYG